MGKKNISEKVKKHLDIAMGHAEEGSVIEMEFVLLPVKETYSSDKKIASQIEDILSIGYRKGTSKSIGAARKYAERGNAHKMETELSFATEYANYIGANIEDECDHVRTTLA